MFFLFFFLFFFLLFPKDEKVNMYSAPSVLINSTDTTRYHPNSSTPILSTSISSIPVSSTIPSQKHAYIILTLLKLQFYTVKLGFTEIYIIFLISAQKHRLWVLIRTTSNEYPQFMFEQKNELISDFLSENFQFLVVKFSVYLNRRVFAMERETGFCQRMKTGAGDFVQVCERRWGV